MGNPRQASGEDRRPVSEAASVPRPTGPVIPSGDPERHRLISPVTGEVLREVRLATRGEIIAAARRLMAHPCDTPAEQLFAFFRRLKGELEARRAELVRVTVAETGFIFHDAEEIVD